MSRGAPKRRDVINGYMREHIMCGQPYPITRLQAVEAMRADGMPEMEITKAIGWFKPVSVQEWADRVAENLRHQTGLRVKFVIREAS